MNTVNSRNSRCIVSKPRAPGGIGAELGISKGLVAASFVHQSLFGNLHDVTVSTDSINDGVWHSVTHVNDGSTVKIYVDGQIADTESYPPGPATSDESILTEKELHKPAAQHGMRFYKGDIDEVRIYNWALSAREVKAL